MARRGHRIATLLLGLGLGVSLTLIVAGDGGSRGAQAARPPVSVRLGDLGQYELARTGRLTLNVRARRTVRLRLSSSLRSGNGRRVLASPRTLRLRRGHGRTLHLQLRPTARRAVASCVKRRVVVTMVSARGRARTRHSVSGPVSLDPPACTRFFGPRSVWNTPLPAAAALDPQSDAITSGLLREVARSYEAPPHPTINTTSYSTPIYTVGRDQPRVRVKLDQPAGYAPHLESRFASVPVPPGARPAQGSDGHMVVWQPGTDTLWEFWRMRQSTDGWHARWGGRLDDVSTGPGHFAAPVANLGATATSLPLVGGLMTTAELASGRIDHALAMAVPNPRRGVFALPAQRDDGVSTDPSSVPEGARFRLDPSLDVDALGLAPPIRAMARAAQRYGIIVRDRSSVVAFYGEDSSSLGMNPYPGLFGGTAPWDLLRSFPWGHLQLLRMNLVQSPGGGSVLCGLVQCD